MNDIHFVEEFEKLTVDSLAYLDIQPNVADNTTALLKKLYDTTKSIENKTDDDTLPELIIKDFDEEQIWQELELQNVSKLKLLSNTIQSFTNSNLVFLNQLSVLPSRECSYNKTNKKIIPEGNESFLNCNGNIDDDDENEGDDDDENEEDDDDNENDGDDDDIHENYDDISDIEDSETSNFKKKVKKSIVDDEFFKLSEMENFLLSEEKLEMSNNKLQDSEDDIDMFQDQQSDNEEEDNYGPMYQEFFENTTKTNVKKTKSKKKSVRFDMDDSEDNENDENQFNEETRILSTLEKRSERLNKRISQLEEDAVSINKPWPLKGEVTAKDRPQNSLLEEAVEFDVCTRPAPIITEETTVKLEDIILQRIKDKAWDDVERKIKPINAPQEYKKKLVLNQEKSKESLSQIYEKEFVKQREAADPENKNKPEEELPEHKEIDLMIKELFRKLEALTNYHYTPKQAIPDLKIINNLPAISIEEVAPTATTDASLLAPEEIQSKSKAHLLGKDERTSTDKKRERRKKKHLQHKKRIAKESHLKEMEKRGLKPSQNKENDKKELKLLTSSGHQIKELKSVDNMKTSKDFFSKFQDLAKNEIEGKKRIIKQNDRNNSKKIKK